MVIIKVILTTLFSVASLFIITKIMGNNQAAQIDFFTMSVASPSLDRYGA